MTLEELLGLTASRLESRAFSPECMNLLAGLGTSVNGATVTAGSLADKLGSLQFKDGTQANSTPYASLWRGWGEDFYAKELEQFGMITIAGKIAQDN